MTMSDMVDNPEVPFVGLQATSRCRSLLRGVDRDDALALDSKGCLFELRDWRLRDDIQYLRI